MTRIFVACIAMLFCVTNAKAENVIIPRTIIALYDGRINDATVSNIHTLVEMPLNHLGLKVEYYDIHKPLPDIKNRSDVRSVLTWLFFDTKMKDPDKYLKWATDVVHSGKRYVIMGTLGVMGGEKKPELSVVNSFMGELGIKMTHGWTETAFNASYSYNTPNMFLSQNAFVWERPSYETVISINNNNTVHLSVRGGNISEDNSDLIITGSHGGYLSSGYIIKTDWLDGKFIRQWVINPFQFFQLAFGTDDLPKPDTPTVAGRRIYYSHIDGDGFNNVTILEEYRGMSKLSSEVIMEKAVKAYPDLPVTLTLIAAEIDPDWAMAKKSRKVAQEFFTLPQVEAGSHTFSHPFEWGFFKDGNINKEIPYLPLYAQNGKYTVWKPEEKRSLFQRIFFSKNEAAPMKDGNQTPRAYAHTPFDVNKEIHGSLKEISTLLPPGKKVEIVTWSGSCKPWEAVIHAARVEGVQNINGGDTMFDSLHPYYATVAPIGIQVGNERQIYASSSNEIPYTDEWRKDFDGLRHLKETLINTDRPIRLKPLNIYYHLYSGEREAGLRALLSNLDYAHKQNIAPVKTSYYTRIAEGFYTTNIIRTGNDRWRILDRGELNTIRFDNHTSKSVDFLHSKGVIGQKHLNGSLYVYLDRGFSEPEISLKDNRYYFEPPTEPLPYLIDSRWLISNLYRNGHDIYFDAQGYGKGAMIWKVPYNGKYRISINDQFIQTVSSSNNELVLKINADAIKTIRLKITKV